VPSSPAHSRLASSALRVPYLNYSDSSYVYLKLTTTTTTANTTANFLRLNDDIDHDNDNINFIEFIYGDHITNDIIDHNYIVLAPGYIDINNKGNHLTSGLYSSQTVRITTTARGREGGVLDYISVRLY
jgi:hypothetical protein